MQSDEGMIKGSGASRRTVDYKDISVEESFKLLQTTASGLSESEASRRLDVFGANEVVARKRNPLVIFLLRFWGPMPWLLELAIVLASILKHFLEASIIAALIFINAIIGFQHDRSSRKAMEMLKAKLAVKAAVLRDGKYVNKDAVELVPGDMLVVSMGDIVPADAKIVSGDLSVDQSTLTGESLPVEIHEKDVIYSSSIIKRGEAQCLVVNTGGNTQFGTTAELVNIARPKSLQEETMVAIVKYMLYLGIAALIVVSIDAVLAKTAVVTIATFAVTFLLGAIPAALPAVLTIAQAVGAMELAGEGVLVTRLDSIEDAASVDVLCLDKTGTLTMNELAVHDIVPFSGYDEKAVVTVAALTAKPESKDGIDSAIKSYADSISVNLDGYTQISVQPFEPATKRSEAVIEEAGKQFRAIKGASQVIFSLCEKNSEEVIKAANIKVEELSRKGYRTLAVSKSRDENPDNLELVGLLALADPPRQDAKAVIAEIKSLGIKPLMLTGDNLAIAREIANQVDIGDKIIRMSDLKSLDEDKQVTAISECNGLAEVYPEDKYHIVRLLQSRGHIVGMTGDGVNDAPALKQAEIGIAVDGSSDVARASASVVLTRAGIEVIAEAIKTSRQIYQRMLTWVINKFTKTIQFVGLLTIGFFWKHDLVISLLGMALLVFANDFVTMTLSTDNVKQTIKPDRWNVRNITLASLAIGIFFIAEGVITIFIGEHYFNLPFNELLSFVLLMLIVTSQFRVIIVRERGHFWDSLPGKYLLISTVSAIVLFALLAVFGLIITSLTVYQVLFILAFSALFTLATDIPKYYIFKRIKV